MRDPYLSHVMGSYRCVRGETPLLRGSLAPVLKTTRLSELLRAGPLLRTAHSVIIIIIIIIQSLQTQGKTCLNEENPAAVSNFLWKRAAGREGWSIVMSLKHTGLKPHASRWGCRCKTLESVRLSHLFVSFCFLHTSLFWNGYLPIAHVSVDPHSASTELLSIPPCGKLLMQCATQTPSILLERSPALSAVVRAENTEHHWGEIRATVVVREQEGLPGFKVQQLHPQFLSKDVRVGFVQLRLLLTEDTTRKEGKNTAHTVRTTRRAS